jgi:hypothetical protein
MFVHVGLFPEFLLKQPDLSRWDKYSMFNASVIDGVFVTAVTTGRQMLFVCSVRRLSVGFFARTSEKFVSAGTSGC